ncbi:MAG: virginiamycin B lyase family protein, partial [Candidatus Binatia bacterium]
AGTVGFTDTGCNRIGFLDPGTGTVTVFPIPTRNSYPADMKVGPDGKLWFTETNANKIARFDPVTHTFQEFDTGEYTTLVQISS